MSLSESQKNELKEIHNRIAFLLVDGSLRKDLRRELMVFNEHVLPPYLYGEKGKEKPLEAW